MDRNVHNIIVSVDSQTSTDSSRGSNLATQSVLGGDLTEVEELSLDANERRLEATIKGRYAGKVADELESLWAASGFEMVAYYDRSEPSAADGYYVLEDGDFERASTNDDRVQRVEGTLRLAGTKTSHYRAIDVEPTKVDHPWGNTLSCEIGIPAGASVWWVNTASSESTQASTVAARTGQVAAVDVVDADPGSTPYDDPVLVYEAEYGADHPVSCLVWDTLGHASRTNSNGFVQWQRSYRIDHDPRGVFVLDNGLVRVHLDTANGLTAEEYDPGTSAWSTISLPASDWALTAVDVRDIGPTRALAILEFENSVSGESYTLRGLLHRGRPRLQFDRPDSMTTAVPSGLESYLDPLADDSLYDTGGSLGLRDRDEVNA